MRVEKPVFSDEGFEKNLILYDCERDGLVSSVDFCVFPERRYLLSGWGGYQAFHVIALILLVLSIVALRLPGLYSTGGF